MKTAIVLLGHGSADAAGVAEFAALQDALRQTRPGWSILAGVLEFPNETVPAVQTAIDRAVAAGAGRVLIAPILLFPAGHARLDVPREIALARRRHPGSDFVAAPHLAADEVLLDLVSDRIGEAARLGDSPDDPAILLVGRGSTHATANAELARFARLLAEHRQVDRVDYCFVSLTPPAIPAAIERCARLGARQILVVPYFLNTGVLVKRIAEQVAATRCRFPGLDIRVTRHFGVDDRLLALIARQIEEAAERAGWDPADAPNAADAAGGLLARHALPTDRIEATSLDRIEAFLGSSGCSPLDRWTGSDRLLAKRLIYAAGDLALAEAVRIHPDAVSRGVMALRGGATIVTDVRMVEAGLSRGLAARLGCPIVCAVDAQEVAARALATGRSRSVEGIEALIERLDGAVVAIGNAPTALLHLLDTVDAGRAKPALIAGLPVGFVAAAEAKEELLRRPTPFVTIVGQRGGSGLAAAAINTLLRLATGDETR